MKVRKAVLPVAGLGTRFLPASKAIAKEMITVVDKPVIQYVVEEAVAAGIEQIILVTHASKRAIEDHFDVNYELENELARRGKHQLLQALRDGIPKVSVVAVRQGQALGLGHAVLCAREAVGDEPFAVLLPDVLVDNHEQGHSDLARMIRRYREHSAAQVMVAPVPRERTNQYGIVALAGEAPAPGDSVAMTGIVEKPAPAQAPSNLSVVGRYVLPADIFALLANTPPGAGDEIQLTDAIATLMQQHPVAAYCMTGATYDCGNKLGYLEATLAYARRHPEVGNAFLALLNDHLADG